MKCSKCGKQAVHFFSRKINGKSSVLFLCDDCFRAGAVFDFSTSAKPDKTKSCRQCGTRLNEFLQTGYLGCSNCYVAFADEIQKILPQTQVGVKHAGK